MPQSTPSGTAPPTAVEHGDLEAVKALIAEDAYWVFSQHEERRTPLHEAAAAGQDKVVALLLDHGADAKASDRGGATPLHMAAASGHLAVVDRLLKAGASPGAKDNQKATPLHLAARGGFASVVASLLADGADPNANGAPSGTPLHEAAAGGWIEVAEHLLAVGANANGRSTYAVKTWTPLEAARQNKQAAMANLLLAYGGGDAGSGPIGIHRASELGYPGRVRALLGLDPDVVRHTDFLLRRTALHWAAQSGHVDIARSLLAAGAKVGAHDKRGQTPLDLAEAAGHVELAGLLRGSRA